MQPGSIQILPVVEITAFAYSERECPSGAVPRDEWDEYVRLCAEDAGLDQLRPIAPGSWFYHLSGLTDANVLRTLAQHELAATLDGAPFPPGNEYEEYFSAMDGGLVVLIHGDLITSPGCCCDLRELEEWQAAVTERGADWTELWAGHDADSVRIRFSAQTGRFEFQLSDWQQQKWERAFDLPAEHAKAMLRAARQEQEAFAERMALHLPAGVPQAARLPLAQLFAGLSPGGPATEPATEEDTSRP